MFSLQPCWRWCLQSYSLATLFLKRRGTLTKPPCLITLVCYKHNARKIYFDIGFITLQLGSCPTSTFSSFSSSCLNLTSFHMFLPVDLCVCSGLVSLLWGFTVERELEVSSPSILTLLIWLVKLVGRASEFCGWCRVALIFQMRWADVRKQVF